MGMRSLARTRRECLLALALVACGEAEVRAPPAIALDGGALFPDAGSLDAGAAERDAGRDLDASASDAGPPCDTGEPCDPIPIDVFPFEDARDTRDSRSAVIDRYDCAPGTDESGPEIFYVITLSSRGLFSAEVDDTTGDGVDIDLHVLRGPSLDGSGCLARDNRRVSLLLDPGTYYLVADSFVNARGEPLAGAYRLRAELIDLEGGRCALREVDLRMFWTSCSTGASFTCYEAADPASGALSRFLVTPAVGPVVLEAHLVTVAETFPGGWPASSRDAIERHYALSEEATGYTMPRAEPWAPAGEGGSMWGQGATGQPLPVIEESWYVNMYWRDRPARGTRMIVLEPQSGRAAVAAAGYETGPGSNTAIAGVSEEIHHHLGTAHRDTLLIGFAAAEDLPYGPIDCR